MGEDEDPLLVAHHDVRQTITVVVHRLHLGANPRSVVDDVGHEVYRPVGPSLQLEPVKHRRGAGVGIARRPMCPETLAGHDVLESVAIDVHQINAMELAELHAVGVLRDLLVHDDVLLEVNLRADLRLLIPGQSIPVGREAGDHIIQPIAVHVVGIHLRAAQAEGNSVVLPHRVTSKRGRLLPPTILFEQIHTAVAVDVTHTETVGEPVVLLVG